MADHASRSRHLGCHIWRPLPYPGQLDRVRLHPLTVFFLCCRCGIKLAPCPIYAVHQQVYNGLMFTRGKRIMREARTPQLLIPKEWFG
jgi:hypothetical protein